MVYKSNFRVLDDGALVDPELKVFVTLGRMHLDGEGVQVLHILHDPEMGPRVLQRADQWELADRAGDKEAKASLGDRGFSDKNFAFFEFLLEKITEEQTLVWEFQNSEEKFLHSNLRSYDGEVYECSDRKAFLLYVFENLLLIPELSRWGFHGYTKVKLRISAAKLAALKGRPAEGLSGDIILDEREVKAAR